MLHTMYYAEGSTRWKALAPPEVELKDAEVKVTHPS